MKSDRIRDRVIFFALLSVVSIVVIVIYKYKLDCKKKVDKKYSLLYLSEEEKDFIYEFYKKLIVKYNMMYESVLIYSIGMTLFFISSKLQYSVISIIILISQSIMVFVSNKNLNISEIKEKKEIIYKQYFPSLDKKIVAYFMLIFMFPLLIKGIVIKSFEVLIVGLILFIRKTSMIINIVGLIIIIMYLCLYIASCYTIYYIMQNFNYLKITSSKNILYIYNIPFSIRNIVMIDKKQIKDIIIDEKSNNFFDQLSGKNKIELILRDREKNVVIASFNNYEKSLKVLKILKKKLR